MTTPVRTTHAGRTYQYLPAVDALPCEGVVRVDPYRGLPAVLAEHGLDSRAILAEMGLDPALLDNPENRISYRDLERLTLHCERRTGCDYIGVRIGQRARLANMGRPGQLARCQGTAREAVRAFTEHFNLYNSAATVSLVRDGIFTSFVYAICEQGMSDTCHLQMGALALTFNILQDLCGSDFVPTQLTFACRSPSNVRPLQRLFRVPMRFNCSESAMVFEDRWLDVPLPPVEAEFRRGVEAEISAQRATAMRNFPATVRCLVRKQLLLGRSSMQEVAGLLSMHRRTLTRRLNEHGVGYRDLLEAVQRDVARQLLHDTELQVQQVAESLHFSSAANFTTAFKRWCGLTPSAYRAAIGRRQSTIRVRPDSRSDPGVSCNSATD